MDERDRTIGQLEGKYEALHADVAEIKRDVKSLLQAHWMTRGKTIAYSVIASAIFTVIVALLKG